MVRGLHLPPAIGTSEPNCAQGACGLIGESRIKLRDAIMLFRPSLLVQITDPKVQCQIWTQLVGILNEQLGVPHTSLGYRSTLHITGIRKPQQKIRVTQTRTAGVDGIAGEDSVER